MSEAAKQADFIPAKEAAFLICKSVDFLERLRREGRGPEWQVLGSRIYYSRAALMRWLEAGRNKRVIRRRSTVNDGTNMPSPR